MKKYNSGAALSAFIYVLGLALCVAKINGFINWSWWIILAPQYITVVLLFVADILALGGVAGD